MSNTNHIIDIHHAASKEMRAQRLKRLRKTTGLSRKDFSKKYDISPGTLQNWETARFGGLTEKGANLMVRALKCEQIFCSFEWLMYQSGQGPNIDNASRPPQAKSIKPTASKIESDLAYYKNKHPNCLYTFIEDDTMTPYFRQGQVVAGIKRLEKQIQDFFGHICIVQTTCLNAPIIRVIKPSSKDKHYHLIHLNTLAPSQTDLGKNYLIKQFAPIEWIRWPS